MKRNWLLLFVVLILSLTSFACDGDDDDDSAESDDDAGDDTTDDDSGDDDTTDDDTVDDDAGDDIFYGEMLVLGYNDLGMHCMNEDFSTLMILPPFNNLHAQVIRRAGEDPQIVDSGVTVHFEIPANTTSVDKTNFWDYVDELLGVSPAPDVGLTGTGLAGDMVATGDNDWVATGIPVTPLNDNGDLDAYNLATVNVTSGGDIVAQTRAVVPVSWEISCDLCHEGANPYLDILQDHDDLHGTSLVTSTPVFCGGCHLQASMGAFSDGAGATTTLSGAMHSAHAARMEEAGLDIDCYACHPGVETQCQRDVHKAEGISCLDCHGTMAEVGDPGRSPWVDEPACGDCHDRAGFEFEQPGTLYRNSKGHMGVHCAACHGSPHAITPTMSAEDNLQAEGLQGHAGTIDTCVLCHTEGEDDEFPHRLSEGDDDDDDKAKS